jgi:uncharacterized membrane protein YgcG
MRGLLDFSSWPGLLSTLLGFSMVTLVAVGIRLLIMQTIQQRRQRENRQINERLKTLIAAYKVLGGSFTGDLLVDPTHKRQLRTAVDAADGIDGDSAGDIADSPGGERRRRIRDAVEAALSDVILLGTEEQVRLAAKAAVDLGAGRPVATADLVVSLRNFIRKVLDLDSIPDDVLIPKQGASRPPGGGGRSGGGGSERERGGGGRGSGGGGGAAAGGAGMDVAVGAGMFRTSAPSYVTATTKPSRSESYRNS